VDLPTLRALLTPEGRRLLNEVGENYDDRVTFALSERLRREYPADLVAAALTQADLRLRARVKFGPDADRMLFTPEALEQATRRSVADHRAQRIAAALPGGRILDLGCGIGGDLVAFASSGLGVTGVEHDPIRAEIAWANLAALGLRGEVLSRDVSTVDWSRFDAVYADPSRRQRGRRVFDAAAYTPSWQFVLELLTGDACVKVAPGIPHRMLPDGVEAEWVSDVGDLKEAALWSGQFVDARRRATLLPGGDTLTDADDPGEVPAGTLGEVVYEPDPAVIRAGLIGAVAAIVGGALLDPRIAYVAGGLVRTPFARAYRVVDDLPFRERALRAALRERDIGPITIKKRGVDIVPEALRKRLALRGRHPATVILTRMRGRAIALLVEPVPAED
jgi:SAM-dependent methyltransferase